MTNFADNNTKRFEIKQDSTMPRLETVLLDGDGQPLDLTNATSVTLRMRLCAHPRTLKLANATAGFTASATGEVWYQWVAGDTDTVGKYDIQWTVTYPGGGVEKVPSKGFDQVEVTSDL